MADFVFLKLGGSLITDKTKPYTPRFDKLAEVAAEVKSALTHHPDLNLILGHGSGSFGHYAVNEQSSRLKLPAFPNNKQGERTGGYWNGFSEVWFQASTLNRFVMDALHTGLIPAISLPPSALVTAQDGIINHWDLTSLQSALNAGLLPVIYGDMVFDEVRGGVVLSTEALLFHLAHRLSLKRVLLAGLEAAVWADYPSRLQAVRVITKSTIGALSDSLGASHGMDVTGGMRSKVEEMLRLVEQIPELTVQIFSGEQSGNIDKALSGKELGTKISKDNG